MVKKPTSPPSRDAVRRPLDSIDSLSPSSLPPELGSLDMSWDDDPRSIATIDLLQHSDYDLDIDAGERTTAVPEIPIDQLVQATMAEADARESAPGRHQQMPHDPLEQHWPSNPAAPPQRALAPRDPTANDASAMDRRQNPPYDKASLQTQPAPARGVAPSRNPEPQASTRRTSESAGQSHSASEFEFPNFELDPLSISETPNSRGARPSGPPPSVPAHDDGFTSERMSAPPTLRHSEAERLRQQMKDRYATGDFSGALQLAETLLEADRDDLEAQRFATSCRDVLTQMLISRLGAFDQIVEVSLTQEELRWLNLDHRAGFLLSLVDGCSTIEELLDISGMARLESLRILSTLLDQRVVRLSNH